jgi:hypothetical protein
LRVLHHLPQIRVDDLLEELVLGGAWWSHGDLELIGKQNETRTMGFSAMRWSDRSGVYIDIFFILGNKNMEGKQSMEGSRGGHNPPGRATEGRCALVYHALLGCLPVYFLFS